MAHAAVPTSWCGDGTPSVQADRLPDFDAGELIQVIYAHPSDAPDRFGELADRITTDMATADAWWRSQDPTRTLRFDLFAFPSCATTLGRLDLSDVALPHSEAYYFSLQTRYDRVTADLAAQPFAYHNRFKVYLVYYDAAVEEQRVCGEGGQPPGLPPFTIVFVQTCRQAVGDGRAATITAVHEMVHGFGAVPSGAPHECTPPNGHHVCDSPNDLMYPINAGGAIEDEILDLNHDDYYGTGRSNDTRSSPFLSHLDTPRFASNVALAGTGRVDSDLPGVGCTSSCAAEWDAGTSFTLTASPADGERFVGWSGACTGNGTCSLTMDAQRSVTATFAPELVRFTLRASIKGKGRVTSSPLGISCPTRCTSSFDSGTSLRLSAKPAKGYRFAGWTGSCKGRGACVVALTADASVKATFAKKK
jgi:Divergent InlB B-repeat domain